MYLSLPLAAARVKIPVGQFAKLLFMFCISPEKWENGIPLYSVSNAKKIKKLYACIIKNNLNQASESDIEFRPKNSAYYRRKRKAEGK
jgi:hypothetical protein